MKKKQVDVIGTRQTDNQLYLWMLENEVLTDEEKQEYLDEDFKMPKLKGDKFCFIDFYRNGKPHPKADDILRWIMEKGEENVPDSAEEIMKMFD